jgi:phosphoribosylanthranilate isomerase
MVQVAGVSSLEECLFCHSAGVDAVGFTLELPGGIHDGLTPLRAARIIANLPRTLLPVVITYLTDVTAARDLVQHVAGQAIQFHGGLSNSRAERFRALCPGVKTVGRVTVSGPDAIQQARTFEPSLWDALILDSRDPHTGRIGATGRTHDWAISRTIVQVSRVPILLAGGLSPANVREAIETVRPAGVDAHTGLERTDGSRDWERIRQFSHAARAAFATLHQNPI